MNEKYTYGYGLGWNVENEYINDIIHILDNYNTQKNVLDALHKRIPFLEADIIRNAKQISDEDLREWYNNDNISMPFDEYKKQIIQSMNENVSKTNVDLEKNREQYLANLYYLIKIKDKTRPIINQKRRELELLLEEKRIQLSSINLESRRNSIEYDKNQEIRKRYDNTFLEIKKIEHALESLDEMMKNVEYTQEELDLMLSGLNPIAKKIYDEMDKPIIEDNQLEDNIPGDDIPGDDIPGDDIPGDDIPGDDIPGDDIPEDDIPEDDIPEDDIPEDDIPEDDELEDDIKYDNIDARKLMILLSGNKEDYKKGDNFALKYKNIKIFGWKKYKERTILDKPIRLVKLGIGGIIKAPLKFFAKLSFMSKKKRLNLLIERVNKLTPKELDVLIDYGITNLKEFRPPEAVLTALLPKLSERINERLLINNNLLIKMKEEIINIYIEAKKIYLKIKNGNLSEEEKKVLFTQFKKLSDQLLFLVTSSYELKKATDELVNPARLGDQFEISKNLRDGGFMSKNSINHDVDTVDMIFGDKLEKAINSGNGFIAADIYLSRDKLDKDNTEIKRTLKNKFGKTSVGSRYFNPFVEMEDFTKNPYVSDLLQTAVLAMSVCNLFKQIGLQKELDQYRQIIVAQNQAIQNFQARYALLEGKALNILDPATQQAFADELRTLATTQAGYIQGICEDFAQKAQAGAIGASSPIIDQSMPVYDGLDTLAHTSTGKFINAINNIPTNVSPSTQIAQFETILNDMNKFMVDFTTRSIGDVSKYMAINTGFNYTAEQAFAQTIAQTNPALAVDLNYRLIDIARDIISLPTLTTIQNLTANADIVGAIAILTGVLGKEVVMDELSKTMEEGKFMSVDELTDKYSSKLDEVETIEGKEAREQFERDNEEFESQSRWRKWRNRKEKPNKYQYMAEYYQEEADSIHEEFERRK